MLGTDWIFQTYKNHENIFSESELEHFLNSIRRSSVIASIGYHRSYPRLERLERRLQWPVWKKIFENNLVEELFPKKEDAVEELQGLLELEKEIFTKKRPAHELRWAVYKRIRLYPKLFRYDNNDKKWIEKKSIAYEKIMASHLKKSRAKSWAIAGAVLGGAAALYAGAKIYKHAKEKDKEKQDEKNKKEEKDKKKK